MNQLRDMWWSSRESCNRTFGSDVRATTRSSNEQGTRSRSGEEKSRLAFVWRCQAVFGEAKKEPFVRSFVRRCHLVASLLLLLPVTLCCIDSLPLSRANTFIHSLYHESAAPCGDLVGPAAGRWRWYARAVAHDLELELKPPQEAEARALAPCCHDFGSQAQGRRSLDLKHQALRQGLVFVDDECGSWQPRANHREWRRHQEARCCCRRQEEASRVIVVRGGV